MFPVVQVFVLDEYCARYGVRGCFRHLCYLENLLEKCEKHQVMLLHCTVFLYFTALHWPR